MPDIETLTLTINQLIDWGLLRKVRREKLIDELISEESQPNEEQQISIFSKWLELNDIKNKIALEEWLSRNCLNDLELKRIIFREWRWRNWCLNKFKDKVSSYYLERKQLLDRVSYSILRVKDKSLANELFLRINEAESSFEDIAAKYSEGSEKETLGKIGPVPMNQLHPKLAMLLQISKPGQIWPPKKLEGWWIVVKLTEIINTELNATIRLKLSLELGEKKLGEDLKRS